MTILGIEIKHPTFVELSLLAMYIVVIASVGVVLNKVGVVTPAIAWPATIAMATGAILSAFGVSVTKDGWRALVIVLLAASLLWLTLDQLGMLSP